MHNLMIFGLFCLLIGSCSMEERWAWSKNSRNDRALNDRLDDFQNNLDKYRDRELTTDKSDVEEFDESVIGTRSLFQPEERYNHNPYYPPQRGHPANGVLVGPGGPTGIIGPLPGNGGPNLYPGAGYGPVGYSGYGGLSGPGGYFSGGLRPGSFSNQRNFPIVHPQEPNGPGGFPFIPPQRPFGPREFPQPPGRPGGFPFIPPQQPGIYNPSGGNGVYGLLKPNHPHITPYNSAASEPAGYTETFRDENDSSKKSIAKLSAKRT